MQILCVHGCRSRVYVTVKLNSLPGTWCRFQEQSFNNLHQAEEALISQFLSHLAEGLHCRALFKAVPMNFKAKATGAGYSCCPFAAMSRSMRKAAALGLAPGRERVKACCFENGALNSSGAASVLFCCKSRFLKQRVCSR